MYEIDFDPVRKLLVLRTEGFWSLGTLAAFAAAALARGAIARARYGRYAILADSRKLPVQSAEVARALDAVVSKSLALSDAPYACVVGSMLVKLQAERVLNRPNCRVFLDMDEATAWLDQEWVQRRAA